MLLPARALLRPATQTFQRTTLLSRAMSSLPTRTFLIYAPDLPDAAPRRAKVRPSHLANNEEKMESGQIMIGGALLDKDGKMVGSGIVVKMESLEAAKAWIEEDVYYKSGVWDPEKLIITEFRPAPPPEKTA